MAIYHLHVGIVSRKTGRSSVAAAAYRSAEKLHSDFDGLTHDYTSKSNVVNSAAYRSGESLHNERDGVTHDYTRKYGVVHSEIMLPENAPKEFQDRATLWNAVEKSEKRRDAQTARDIDVALPIELSRDEQIQLMHDYIQENFIDKGMCADFAMHDKGDGNPHAHILLTTRHVSEKGFGNKNRDWNKPEYLKSWRKNWADICNERLEQKGLNERIDHRTLEAQGIDREPTIHIGIGKYIPNSDRVRKNNEIIKRNKAFLPENIAEYIHELKEGYIILYKEINALQQETAEVRQEMNALRVKAEEITERTEQIQSTQKRINELKGQKNADRQVIQRLEHSYKQATAYFKSVYNMTLEEAVTEVKRLESRAESKKHLQEKLQDKTAPLIEERDIFVLEYQRQKLLADIRPDNQKIHENLARFSRQQSQSPQERLAWVQSERILDTLTEQNFGQILKNVQPEHANELIQHRERERVRERTRER